MDRHARRDRRIVAGVVLAAAGMGFVLVGAWMVKPGLGLALTWFAAMLLAWAAASFCIDWRRSPRHEDARLYLMLSLLALFGLVMCICRIALAVAQGLH